MTISLEYARAQLRIWLDAERAVATGQSYSIGTRSLTRVNLADILRQILRWQDIVDQLESGRKPAQRARRAVPRDL